MARRPKGSTRGEKKPRKLSGKRAAFVSEYLKDHNGARAARAAGYSAATAKAAACRLLTFADVKAAIEAGEAKAAERNDITLDRVLREYAKIAFSDIADYVSAGPGGVAIRELDAIPKELRGAIAEVSESDGGEHGGMTRRVKLHPKLPALDALGKHLGMSGGTLEVKVQGAIEGLLEEIRPLISDSAYAELVRAMAQKMGIEIAKAEADA